MALVEIKVPDIGDFDEVAVIELLVKPGDAVTAEQSLITVESDKASMEIPSSAAGVVKELKVKIGDKVKQGSVVLMLEAAGAAAAPAAAAPVQPALVAAPPPPPAPAAAPSAGGTIDVAVPDIGDFKDVAVIEVFVKPGDTVKVEQSLITVESDKASMEIPSSHAGVVKTVLVKVGDKVNMGSPLVVLEGSAGAAAPAAAPVRAELVEAPAASTSPSTSSGRTESVPAHDPTAAKGALPHASPSIRKFARELGVPLTEVKGSGPKGRITQTDVQGFVKGVMSGDTQTAAQKGKAPAGAAAGGAFPGLLPWPQVDFSKFGETERKDLSRIKKISGANLHRNWVVIPHVTNHDDADITELEAFRVATNKENEKSGVKVTMLAFLIKASVAALKKFPDFNSSLDGEQLGVEEVLPHRLCRRHAQRPGGAGDQGRRQEGRDADQHRDGRAGEEGARRQARVRPTCPAPASRSARSAASAGATSRRSSTRPRSRSSACARARSSRSGTARLSLRD